MFGTEKAKAVRVEIAEIAAPVQDFFDRFESEFLNRFKSAVPLADQAVNYLARKKGKRLRPLLVFLTASLHGRLTPRTMSAAVVIEMFHTATLVHDDVVDESHLRRGSRTVNDIWGNRISILIGDLLFSKTLAGIVDLQDTEAVAVLAETAERITEGELLQIAYSREGTLSEESYFDLIAKKTASLFNASCQLGAMTVGENGAARRKMAEFGENFGIAFQIMDDLLDYIGDEKLMGKPTGSDLREGKVTLPLIFALRQAESKERLRIIDMITEGISNDEQAKQIIRFADEYGGIQYAHDQVRAYLKNALAVLESYPDSPSRRSLAALVELSTSRNS